jgi:hypothetical protein
MYKLFIIKYIINKMSVITDEVLNSNFPLFDLLYNKTDQREECPQNELIELVDNLRKLFTNRSNINNIQNVLFVLIRIYNLRFGSDEIFDIPFKGTKMNHNKQDENSYDIKFDIRNFPSRLQHILLEYTRLELEK